MSSKRFLTCDPSWAEAHNLQTYVVIQIDMAVEAGTSRDGGNPAGTRVHKDRGRS